MYYTCIMYYLKGGLNNFMTSFQIISPPVVKYGISTYLWVLIFKKQQKDFVFSEIFSL